ncbi:carboxypeptidase-like regulatory domain-containing protein [Pricia sp. S334]|uniref:Carboxypeptidase-like regulatory domain-containing protein n=1 Tax=Pricia mediterranea TaxID=3076079 RepID=A0ABU3L5R6_9FLAO|nr:carboxypeptidase-like regulatory domain-containing protein [Pricia sp. S334]MDT7828691.1 carboxypeptidase-like regulatory domain-containing protein [Pricia sp. S334]
MKKFYFAMAALFMTAVTFSQGTVTGTVVDGETGDVLPGANVVEKGTTNGTTTDFDGNFSIDVSTDSGTLMISYIGYVRQSANFSSSGNIGSITLQPDAEQLAEVVVIGAGVIDLEEDRSTPIAVTTITKDVIQATSTGNVEFPEVMKNVPSVYVSNQQGFGDSQMYLRGFDQTNTAFLLNGQPINGMEDGNMYWSNWQGVMDIANAVQVQRGLGSSKLAISSVGGTVNIVTKATDRKEGGFGRIMTGNDSYAKITASYDSGLNDNGWGFSVMLDHWQAQRKYAEGTKGQGQNYFFSVGKLLGDHNFNFLVFGAPQWHMQRWSQPREVIEEYRLYNQHWGIDEGELESERTNFYHKPVINLNWDWDISDKSDLSTVAYASFGRGGGTGPRGNSALRLPDYQVAGESVSGQIDYAANRERNAIVGVGGDFDAPNGAGYIRRGSMNNHRWFGLVSNFGHEFNEYLTMNVGADFRFYTGDHFRQVIDFYGLQGWSNDRPDDRIVTESYSFNPWKTVFDFAEENERIDYDYSEDINYQGIFGQFEYTRDAYSVFFQGAASNQSYQREDRFATDTSGNQTTETSDKANKFGYNIKSGGAYNFNDKNSAFINAGFYSRQPYLDNVFSGTAELAEPEVDNEEITGIELGYKYDTYDFRLNVNLYRTEWANRFIANGNSIVNVATSEEIDINREQTDVTELHQGLEIDAQYRVMQGLTFGAYTSIGDWKFDGSTPYRTRDFRDNTYFVNEDIGDYVDQNGNPLSANFFNGDVNLDGVEVSNAAQLTFGANVNYKTQGGFEVGLFYNHFNNLYEFVDVADVVAEGSSYETSKLDPYGVMDFTAGYTFEMGEQDIILRTNIYNLFNNAYINQTDAFGVYYGLGRTWNASVMYRF